MKAYGVEVELHALTSALDGERADPWDMTLSGPQSLPRRGKVVPVL